MYMCICVHKLMYTFYFSMGLSLCTEKSVKKQFVNCEKSVQSNLNTDRAVVSKEPWVYSFFFFFLRTRTPI